VYSAFAAREVVREAEQVLSPTDKEHTDDADWIENCLTPAKPPLMPETTSSTEKPRKRNRHN
jgi:hypothetical protein